MSAREDLARLIRDGEGTWRTPLEAADAILAALAPQRVALDAVLALHQPILEDGAPVGCACCDWDVRGNDVWPCATVAAVNDAPEADK